MTFSIKSNNNNVVEHEQKEPKNAWIEARNKIYCIPTYLNEGPNKRLNSFTEKGHGSTIAFFSHPATQ